jgi:hypothetical protein
MGPNDLREYTLKCCRYWLIYRYGYYFVEVDGENRRFFNAHSTTDEIPALLFEAKDLGEGDHSLWFMNQQNYGNQRSRSCKSYIMHPRISAEQVRHWCRLYRGKPVNVSPKDRYKCAQTDNTGHPTQAPLSHQPRTLPYQSAIPQELKPAIQLPLLRHPTRLLLPLHPARTTTPIPKSDNQSYPHPALPETHSPSPISPITPWLHLLPRSIRPMPHGQQTL